MLGHQGRKRRGPACAIAVAMRLAAASSGLFGIVGCDGTTSQTVPDGALQYPQSTKLSTYYQLTNLFDLAGQRKEYAELGAGTAKAGDTLFLNDGSLQAGLMDLERARAMEGALGVMDRQADAVLVALRRLTGRATALGSYFTMRGYLTDGYARARREDPLMLVDFDAAIAAYASFSATVEQATAQEDMLFLKRAQAEGHMNKYYDTRIAQQTRAIRAATVAPTMDSAVAARADALVAGLMPLLARDRAAWAAEAAKLPENERAGNEGDVVGVTEQMIGAYRQYRATGKAEDHARFRGEISSVLQFAD